MAVTLDADGLAEAIGAEATIAGRLLPVASALVTRYAPDAPDPIQNEAVIRFAGYLAQSASASRFGAVRSLRIAGISLDTTAAHGAAFRSSGAAALLSQWRVRRAGVIG